jgi:hypothetical protein
MGLFFEVLSAINNPNQQGSADQLSTLMNSVQQLGAGRGINAPTLQTALSAVGNFIQPALKQQSTAGGDRSLDQLVGQLADSTAGTGALQSLLSPQLQQQMVQSVSQRTGLSDNTLQTLLPGLLSTAMGFLNMGANKPGVSGSNPVLSAFLDSDRESDTDLGTVFKFASRFLDSPR